MRSMQNDSTSTIKIYFNLLIYLKCMANAVKYTQFYRIRAILN